MTGRRRLPSRWLFLVPLVLVFALPGLAGPASASAAVVKGMNLDCINLTENSTSTTPVQDLTAEIGDAGAGAGWVRITMPFRLLQPQNPATASTASPGQYWNSLLPAGETFANNWPSPYWSQLTNCASWAHEHGLSVELVIDQSSWAGATENVVDPSNDADFAQVMGTLAVDYAPVGNTASYGVNAIEIWNEANSDPSNTLGWGGTEAQYTTMLCDAYQQIHQWSPSTLVVSAGTKRLDYNWTVTLLNTAGSCFDVLGIHPYPKITSQWSTPAVYLNGGVSSGQTANDTLSAISALIPHKPIWFTEEGFASSGGEGIGASNVGPALTDFYNYINGGCSGCSDVQTAMWYTSFEPGDVRSIFTATENAQGNYDGDFNPLAPFTDFTNINPCYPNHCS